MSIFSLTRTMSGKTVFPAADRNKAPILEVLRRYWDAHKPGNVLEISSGTGQHVSFFATHFPLLTFQPSEFDASLLSSIKAYADDTSTHNVLPPANIDVTQDHTSWPLPPAKEYDYILNINMIHYAPFECTQGLFRSAGAILKPGGLLVTYGPYALNGVLSPQSNVDFNAQLKLRDARTGVRDIKDLKQLAEENGIQLMDVCDMPANNKCLIWEKMQ